MAFRRGIQIIAFALRAYRNWTMNALKGDILFVCLVTNGWNLFKIMHECYRQKKKRKICGILTEYQKPCSSKLQEANANISDTQLAELPSNIFQNKENKLNVSGTMNFAPVLNSCSNITFNIHVKND